MGVNYYTKPKPPCECCGRPHYRLHIGKSSVGWTFAFAPYPELGLISWKAWRRFLTAPGVFIVDEYGKDISVSDLINKIEEKQLDGMTGPEDRVDSEGYRFSSTSDFS